MRLLILEFLMEPATAHGIDHCSLYFPRSSPFSKSSVAVILSYLVRKVPSVNIGKEETKACRAGKEGISKELSIWLAPDRLKAIFGGSVSSLLASLTH